MSKEIISQQIDTINIPELDAVRERMNHPAMKEYAGWVQATYLDVINKLSTLPQEDVALISTARAACAEQGLSLSSASDWGADKLITTIGPSTQSALTAYAQEAITPGSQLNNIGFSELSKRMTKGHELAVSGKSLQDGDPEADVVIWGHTKGLQPKALTHFVFCHFMERAVSAALKQNPDPAVQAVGQKKDYFLNAMNDVIRLEVARGNSDYDEVLRIWSTSREKGGLQWSSTEKQRVFDQTVNSNKQHAE